MQVVNFIDILWITGSSNKCLLNAYYMPGIVYRAYKEGQGGM